MGSLHGLKVLDLSMCPAIRRLPEGCTQLKELAVLKLDDCVSIEDISAVRGMVSLVELHLRNCAPPWPGRRGRLAPLACGGRAAGTARQAWTRGVDHVICGAESTIARLVRPRFVAGHRLPDNLEATLPNQVRVVRDREAPQ